MENCRTCVHWKADGWERDPKFLAEKYPPECICGQIQDEIDIDIEQRGWDGYGEVGDIWTKPGFGCTAHKEVVDG